MAGVCHHSRPPRNFLKPNVSPDFAPNLRPKSSAADLLPRQLKVASLCTQTLFPVLRSRITTGAARQLPALPYDAQEPRPFCPEVPSGKPEMPVPSCPVPATVASRVAVGFLLYPDELPEQQRQARESSKWRLPVFALVQALGVLLYGSYEAKRPGSTQSLCHHRLYLPTCSSCALELFSRPFSSCQAASHLAMLGTSHLMPPPSCQLALFRQFGWQAALTLNVWRNFVTIPSTARVSNRRTPQGAPGDAGRGRDGGAAAGPREGRAASTGRRGPGPRGGSGPQVGGAAQVRPPARPLARPPAPLPPPHARVTTVSPARSRRQLRAGPGSGGPHVHGQRRRKAGARLPPVTLTCLKNSGLTDESLKMSQGYSARQGAGSKEDSPAAIAKWSSLRDFCSTSSFQHRGHCELSRTCSFNKKEKDPALTHEHLEAPSRGSASPAASPSQRKKSVFPRKEQGGSPELCETPKVRRKPSSSRRRLDLAFTLLRGDSDPQSSSLESSGSLVLSLEKHIPDSTSGFPKQDNFSPLVTSTIKTEGVPSSSQKSRLSFSQHRTSTVDDPTGGECGLFEVECLSPIQGNDFKGSITHDFSDSSLSVSDENTCPELLSSSGSQTTYGADVTTSVTPVSSLISKIRFKGGQTLSSTAEVRDSLSTPEDSGFSSLSWDKSEDSLSDQEGSLQELFRKHKGTPRVGNLVKKPKHLGRLRRLSTLREQGSQSETEDEKHVVPPNSETRVGTASGILEGQGGSNEKIVDSALSFEKLSNTPALQLVHELFMKSKRKRSQQEFFEERDDGKIDRLQRLLAGLIGKKMGIEHLDILTELQYRNLKHILAMVLDSLTSESLYSAWNVSRNWRDIVAQDKKANERRKLYIIHLKANSQGAVLHVQDAATRLQLLSRSALRSVQAQAQAPTSQNEPTPSLSPWGDALTPVASSSFTHLGSKQEQYVRVARTLFSDEALKPCPRCQSPAKYQPYKKRGLCSRLACGFDFCVLCLCAYHGSEECIRGSAKPRSSKDALPGSAQSKRNLKRL
ncbi:F-box only protein 43 [Onychomys torridus]|uniref:F-box only protein 43 n=1 Tax=Onychomys torridus TaxID=38674 RepID=UPI00167F3E19|nr:F-box only protein 43 [Onychomys torridus]